MAKIPTTSDRFLTALRRRMLQQFRGDIEKTQILVGRDLSSWLE